MRDRDNNRSGYAGALKPRRLRLRLSTGNALFAVQKENAALVVVFVGGKIWQFYPCPWSYSPILALIRIKFGILIRNDVIIRILIRTLAKNLTLIAWFHLWAEL